MSGYTIIDADGRGGEEHAPICQSSDAGAEAAEP